MERELKKIADNESKIKELLTANEFGSISEKINEYFISNKIVRKHNFIYQRAENLCDMRYQWLTINKSLKVYNWKNRFLKNIEPNVYQLKLKHWSSIYIPNCYANSDYYETRGLIAPVPETMTIQLISPTPQKKSELEKWYRESKEQQQVNHAELQKYIMQEPFDSMMRIIYFNQDFDELSPTQMVTPTREQKQIIDHICHFFENDNINTNFKTIAIDGPAGSGKTTILRNICERISVFTHVVYLTVKLKLVAEIHNIISDVAAMTVCKFQLKTLNLNFMENINISRCLQTAEIDMNDIFALNFKVYHYNFLRYVLELENREIPTEIDEDLQNKKKILIYLDEYSMVSASDFLLLKYITKTLSLENLKVALVAVGDKNQLNPIVCVHNNNAEVILQNIDNLMVLTKNIRCPDIKYNKFLDNLLKSDNWIDVLRNKFKLKIRSSMSPGKLKNINADTTNTSTPMPTATDYSCLLDDNEGDGDDKGFADATCSNTHNTFEVNYSSSSSEMSDDEISDCSSLSSENTDDSYSSDSSTFFEKEIDEIATTNSQANVSSDFYIDGILGEMPSKRTHFKREKRKLKPSAGAIKIDYKFNPKYLLRPGLQFPKSNTLQLFEPTHFNDRNGAPKDIATKRITAIESGKEDVPMADKKYGIINMNVLTEWWKKNKKKINHSYVICKANRDNLYVNLNVSYYMYRKISKYNLKCARLNKNHLRVQEVVFIPYSFYNSNSIVNLEQLIKPNFKTELCPYLPLAVGMRYIVTKTMGSLKNGTIVYLLYFSLANEYIVVATEKNVTFILTPTLYSLSTFTATKQLFESVTVDGHMKFEYSSYNVYNFPIFPAVSINCFQSQGITIPQHMNVHLNLRNCSKRECYVALSRLKCESQLCSIVLPSNNNSNSNKKKKNSN